MSLKPAGYWFKQRGYTDPAFDRRSATTTGQMLSQSVDRKLTSMTFSHQAPSISNRRHPNISVRFSEHDNRNLIQNYGEYFGRGFGKRFVPKTTLYDHDWIFSNQPRPVHPNQSLTQRDYRGWPPLENPQALPNPIIERQKTSGQWMRSSYDNYGRQNEHIPSELLLRNDYKRLPIHPWHY